MGALDIYVWLYRLVSLAICGAVCIVVMATVVVETVTDYFKTGFQAV